MFYRCQSHNRIIIAECKFLGIILDSNLKYSCHINLICKKISKCIGILFKIKSLVPQSCLRNVYFSFIHSYLLYCLPIWGGAYSTHLQPIVILQKRAIRIISGASYLAHTNILFYNNKILKFEDMFKFCLALYFYKNKTSFQNYLSSHNYFTRNRNNPVPPFERLNVSQQSVFYNAIKIWNNLPVSIKQLPSEASFKKHLKSFLLAKYCTQDH